MQLIFRITRIIVSVGSMGMGIAQISLSCSVSPHKVASLSVITAVLPMEAYS